MADNVSMAEGVVHWYLWKPVCLAMGVYTVVCLCKRSQCVCILSIIHLHLIWTYILLSSEERTVLCCTICINCNTSLYWSIIFCILWIFGWENYLFISGLKHGVAIFLLYFNKCLLMNYLSGWCAVNLTLAAREEKIMKFIFCHWSWQIELWTSRLVVHLILCCSL